MESPQPLRVHVLDPSVVSAGETDEYRRLSAEAAAGVAVVSTVWRRRDYAATVTAFHSISYDPPSMLVSLYEGARIAEAVTGAGKWALSLLTTEHRGVANWLASPGTPVEGLLSQVAFSRSEPGGCAIIDGALAYFELETFAVHEAATHVVVLGNVVGMGTQPGAPVEIGSPPKGQRSNGPGSMGRGSKGPDATEPGAERDRSPLVHYAGGYRALAP